MYTLAPEVEEVAKGLVAANHKHLTDANISYVFRDRSWKTRDGKTILGKARGRNELDKLLSTRREDFIIMIGEDRWEEMTDNEREALVDHELCHCGVMVTNDGSKKFFLRDHPIEAFPENLARYDFMRQEISHLIENPPSAITVQEKSPLRKIRRETEEV